MADFIWRNLSKGPGEPKCCPVSVEMVISGTGQGGRQRKDVQLSKDAARVFLPKQMLSSPQTPKKPTPEDGRSWELGAGARVLCWSSFL